MIERPLDHTCTNSNRYSAYSGCIIDCAGFTPFNSALKAFYENQDGYAISDIVQSLNLQTRCVVEFALMQQQIDSDPDLLNRKSVIAC